MAWFRIDDKFHTHPKVIAAGNAAVGLFVRCGAYSSDHTTDGFVPTAIARLYGTRKEIAALCTNRLWAEVDGGYRMPDYLEFNPSAEQVKAERVKATERQRRARDAASAQRNGHADVTAVSRRDEGVSHGGVTVPPTRPHPTPTTSSTQTTPPSVPGVAEAGDNSSRHQEIADRYATEAVKRGNPKSASGYMRASKARILADGELARLAALFPTAPADVIANALFGEKGALAYWPRADELEPEPDTPPATVTDIRSRTA